MSNFGSFLVALAGPVARRVMASLGLGVISYGALTLIATQIKDALIANYSLITGQVFDLLNLIGLGQAIGILIGAIIARVAFAAVSRIGVMSS